MNIEQVETFLDLCETRSFNRTADRMGVTQSTVSGRVQALEKALGAALFTRSRAGTALTTEGLRFEPHARALLLSWTEARHTIRGAGDAALSLRIGIQHELAATRIADLVRTFRETLPQTSFYVESDYSTQMCRDVLGGALDLAVLYTPKPHPDLHFEPLGEITFRMVAARPMTLGGVTPETYVLANYAPAFAALHARALPALSRAPMASGHAAVIAGLMEAFDGAAYLPEEEAAGLIATGRCHAVGDAPRLPQSVYSAVHLRHRHRSSNRHLLRVLRGHFPAAGDQSQALSSPG